MKNLLLLSLCAINIQAAPPEPPTILALPNNKIESITDAGTNVNLKWSSQSVSNVIDIGAYPNGPWSAVGNTFYTNDVTVGKIPHSNGFYRVVSQSGFTLNSYPVKGTDCYYDRRPFVGNNNLSVLASREYSTWYDYLNFFTNGVSTYIKNLGNNPCGYSCLQIDVSNKVLYTLENSCYYGATGPFTFREYNLTGTNGLITGATQVNEFITDSTYGDVGEDMIRLKSGGIVVCWKSPTSNYVFQYRAPNGAWKAAWAETNIIQAPSRLTLVQHNDGNVWCFITRDAYWVMPVVMFKEIGGNLVWQWTDESILEKDGEFPVIIAHACDNRILVARSMKPYMMFSFNEQQPEIFRRGASFGICDILNRTNHFESVVYPTAPSGMREQNMSEPISPHAATLVNDTLWVYRQEWNPITRCFDLVYMTSYKDNTWGSRTFLYKAVDGSNGRSGAYNSLATYYNNDLFPMLNTFVNYDKDGQLAIFRVTFP